MRKPFAIILMITILGSGFYIYHEVAAVCDVPLSYRIGYIDDRFDLTTDEARLAVTDAESIWEQATGINLFTYEEAGDLTVNFVFDERQEFAEAEIDFRQHLDASAGVNNAIGETYDILVERYKQLEIRYKNKTASYENNLEAYNQEVQEYNDQGGAPQAVFNELQIERDKLDSELKTVNNLGQRLNDLVKEINNISDKGNGLIESYNENVARYNDTFAETREFTQGDYQAGAINIYKFVDAAELQQVLAHELGHALALDHVADESSVMFDHLGSQSNPLRLTTADLSEFERVCGETTRSFIERLIIRFGL